MAIITKTQIANAVAEGLITKDDLREILEGWKPKIRGKKSDLIRQARVFAVFQMLTAESMAPSLARGIIAAKGGYTGKNTIKRLLDRAECNWQAWPPYEPEVDARGLRTRSITLSCKDAKHFGARVGFTIKITDWKY